MYLITGGAGFIGSAMVWHMNRQGIDDIIIVDKLGTDDMKWRNLVPLRYVDIWPPRTLVEYIEQGEEALEDIDVVIHLGANSSTTETDADHLLDNNYRFSVLLASWAVATDRRFVYASSAAVYGNGALGFDDAAELTPQYRPLNMYGYSKQLFDLYALRQGWLDNIAGLRYFNVFGPNEYHKGNMRSKVHKARCEVADSGEIALFKSIWPQYQHGDQVRDFVYVKDVVRMTHDIAVNPNVNGIFNIGSGQTHSWNDLARGVCAALGKEPNICYTDMPDSLARNYQNYTLADMGRLANSGVQTETMPFADAIRDYVTGYLADGTERHLDPAAEQ